MANLVSCGKVITTHSLAQSDPLVNFNPHKSNINCAIWNHNSIAIFNIVLFFYTIDQVIASCGNDGIISLSHS